MMAGSVDSLLQKGEDLVFSRVLADRAAGWIGRCLMVDCKQQARSNVWVFGCDAGF